MIDKLLNEDDRKYAEVTGMVFGPMDPGDSVAKFIVGYRGCEKPIELIVESYMVANRMGRRVSKIFKELGYEPSESRVWVVLDREKEAINTRYKELRVIDAQKHDCPWCNKEMLTGQMRVGERVVGGRENIICPWCCRNITIVVEGKDVRLVRMDIIRSWAVTMAEWIVAKKEAGLRLGKEMDQRKGAAITTPIVVKYTAGGWEARVGFAIMGEVNNRAAIGANPFDRYFCDNYAIGKGTTQEECLVQLAIDLEKTAESIL